MSKASVFKDVETASAIEVFKLIGEFNADKHPSKVNLSVGAYRTNEGKPWVLPVVKTVEAQIAADSSLNHEYLPVAGLVGFRDAAIKLLLGESHSALTNNRVGGIQALGGTGALRLCAAFLKTQLGYDTVYVSNPTWGNHKGIFKSAGFSSIKEYRYWDKSTKGLDFKGMIEDLSNAPPKSAVILHAVAHNPTGVDPTQDQWMEIANLCKEKDIFVVLDNAYQGFSSGNVDTDAWTSRYFAEQDFEFFVAQSFSKNFGLYNERVGNVAVICRDTETKSKVCSQMELLVRTMWSNPPSHGARVVATVLNNPALFSEWKEIVKSMAERILMMRKELHQKLKAIGCPGNWDHITSQNGMFSYTGLSVAQSEQMVKEFHVYVMKSGRINMCGLTTANIDYVANAINAVVSGNNQQSTQSRI